MKKRSQSNALLVELLIVIIFFMLAAAVLVQVFSTSHRLTGQADVRTEALNDAQNVADMLLNAAAAEDALRAEGFAQGQDGWTVSRTGYTLRVRCQEEAREAGQMLSGAVEALDGEKELFSLPFKSYREGEK